MRKTRRLTRDEIKSEFIKAPAVLEALQIWSAGHYSDKEFLDRLVYVQALLEIKEIEIETCDCTDCVESDDPCTFDCDADDLCEGCRDSILDRQDVISSIDRAQGRF